MQLENDNMESNKEDLAPTVHLCDLPDEIINIIFQNLFSLAAFKIGAVSYAWNKSKRVQRILTVCQNIRFTSVRIY